MNLSQNFIDLPRDIVYQIMIRIPYHKLNQLCNSSMITYQLCNNEQFWLLKSQHDFNILVNSKPTNNTWKQYYDYLYQINNFKLVNVYYGGRKINTIKIGADNKLKSILLKLENLEKYVSGDLYFYYFVYKTGNRIFIHTDYKTQSNKTLRELDLYDDLNFIEIESEEY